MNKPIGWHEKKDDILKLIVELMIWFEAWEEEVYKPEEMYLWANYKLKRNE